MIPVAEAVARVLAEAQPCCGNGLARDGLGRVLAEDLASRRTQPPAAVSAMDGYAVRAEDLARTPAELRIVAEIAAGAAWVGSVGQGEAARIFTGAPVPDGADAIVIQEDCERSGDLVSVRETAKVGAYVRPAGLDFAEGDVLLCAGRRLTSRDIGLAAAMNRPWLPVRRRPRVALLATGDEIALPGEPLGAQQIVSSSGPGLAALVAEAGGAPLSLGVAEDSVDSLRARAAGAEGADILVTMGGPRSASTTWCRRRWPQTVWKSISGGSPCGPASRSCSGAWGARWYWGCPATRSPPSSARCCSCAR